MNFRLDGDRLFVTPQSWAEAIEANKHGKWFDQEKDPEGWAYWVTNKHSEQQLPGKYLGIAICYDLIPHYWKKLHEWTSYGDLFNVPIDVTAALGQLRYTHINQWVFVQTDGLVAANGFMGVYRGDPEDLQELEHTLTYRYVDYLQESVGSRFQEPEYVHARNGGYTKNPDYLKRHPAKAEFPQYPSDRQEALWALLWNHWLENHASETQKELCGKLLHYHSYTGFKNGPELRDFRIYVKDETGFDYDGKGTKAKVYGPKEFSQLK